jgi:hypothetical protein
MSLCSVTLAANRIKVASPQSPLAVFSSGDINKPFDVVFATTVATQARIEKQRSKYLGTFAGPIQVRTFKVISERYLTRSG